MSAAAYLTVAEIAAIEAAIGEVTGLTGAECRTVCARLFDLGRPAEERSAAGRLREACYVLILKHKRDDEIPTNGRFLFYELEQAGAFPKRDERINPKTGQKIVRSPATYLSEATTVLSEEGLIPWDWLNDETRDVVSVSYSETILDDLATCLPICRIDAWGRSLPPLVITESRATKGALVRLADQHLVPLTSVGGMSKRHIVNEIAPLLRGNRRVVLYLGDFEVGGPADQIEDNVRRTLEKHTGRTFVIGVDWTKIALTEEQVNDRTEEGWRLLALAIDKVDKRYKGGKAYRAVEAEALGQGEIVRVVRAWLDQMRRDLGLEPIETVRAREEAERQDVARRLARMRR
jgi:hypothetical protein